MVEGDVRETIGCGKGDGGLKEDKGGNNGERSWVKMGNRSCGWW